MRIAIIAHSLFPIAEPFAGGLESVTYQLVKELVQRGHLVDLHAHADSCRTLPLVPMRTEAAVLAHFDAEHIAASGMSQAAFVQTVIYHDVMARILDAHYDIVHNHSIHHVPILLGNTLGARFITSVHSLADIYLKLGFGALAAVRQTVTTVSDHQWKHLSAIVPIDRTIRNGINLENWTPNYAAADDYCFWMGRMCPEKAPHHAIEACRHSGQRLLLAGPVSDAAYFAEFVEPHLHHNNIDYLGHLTHEEIGPYLRKARALVFTSVWEEPYGLTMAEALACGTPVIAYRVGAAPEIVTLTTGILVAEGDVLGLASAMKAVDAIDRHACRQRAETFCSSAVMSETYLALYHELLGELPACGTMLRTATIGCANPTSHA